MGRSRIPMEDRFWSKVRKTRTCWVWTGATNTNDGYGVIQKPGYGGTITVHRYSAMLHFGMFDTRLQVNHHCDNKLCVRPDHLYLGNQSQNMLDKVSRGRDVNAEKTHCPAGHPYDDANTYLYFGRGVANRQCRACNNARRQARRKAGV